MVHHRVANNISVDRVEVNKLYETFLSISNNGKDALDKEKFKQGLGKLEECGLRNLQDSPFVDRLFTLLDTDKSGTVDLQEFVSGLSLLCKGTPEEKLARE
jgi:serine/threonine-protein phosphatase 2B regulatory subunit